MSGDCVHTRSRLGESFITVPGYVRCLTLAMCSFKLIAKKNASFNQNISSIRCNAFNCDPPSPRSEIPNPKVMVV